MRNLPKLLLIILLLCATATIAQEWKTATFPSRDILTGLSFSNPDTGFICTSVGTVGRTMDAGQSWDIFTVKKGVHLEDVCFLNSQKGFAVGRQGTILGTTDGGYTWNSLHKADTAIWFSEVLMFNDKVGMILGMTREQSNPFGGIALRTTNGGSTWNAVEIPGIGYGGLFQANDGQIFLVSFGRLHESSDLGKTWNSAPLETEKPIRTLSLFKSAGIMGGLGGACAVSADYGRSWNSTPQREDMVLLAAEMISEKEGYLAGASGVMLRTVDGGLHFSADSLPNTANILDMQLSGDRLWAIGSEGSIFYRTLK